MDTWEKWKIDVTGLVKRPRVYTMAELAREYKKRVLPVTLVCAASPSLGTASISTSVWTGVALCDVLEDCKIKKWGPDSTVWVEGAADEYGTSLKAGWAMDEAREILLAYEQDGERLSPDHGSPVRLIVPGCVGGRSFNWLRKIVVKDGGGGDVDQSTGDQARCLNPDDMINELNINSVITTPSHYEILNLNSSTIEGVYTLKGYAYSGGGRKVTRVEISLDGGETWRICEFDHPETDARIPSKYGKYWCSRFWSLDVEIVDLVRTKEIAVRAWDESHNTQPEQLVTNHIMGMMNNSWFKVKTKVVDNPQKGEIKIVFEHPTQPGNQAGGWTEGDRGRHPQPLIVSKMYTLSEVKEHDNAESAWIVVRGNVYDCTEFLLNHPDGPETIIGFAGTDCTEAFVSTHSLGAQALLGRYKIGELLETDSDYASSSR